MFVFISADFRTFWKIALAKMLRRRLLSNTCRASCKLSTVENRSHTESRVRKNSGRQAVSTSHSGCHYPVVSASWLDFLFPLPPAHIPSDLSSFFACLLPVYFASVLYFSRRVSTFCEYNIHFFICSPFPYHFVSPWERGIQTRLSILGRRCPLPKKKHAIIVCTPSAPGEG